MRDIEGEYSLVDSWNDALKNQRLRKAAQSQSIDITALASTPMHDRLTFERSEAIKEKMDERLRRAAPGQLYQGWMAEIEEQVARQESDQGENINPEKSKKKVIRIPPVGRCVHTLLLPSTLLSLSRSSSRDGSYAESSRSVTQREQRTPIAQDSGRRREPPSSLQGNHDQSHLDVWPRE